MKTLLPDHCTITRGARYLSVLGLFLLFSAFSLACSDDPVSGNTVCVSDNDCQLGTVCTANGICESVDCQFCSEDHVCLITEARPQGSCSSPECVLNEDCPDGVPCVSGICGGNAAQCSGPGDCPTGQTCNFAGRCVESNNGGTTGCEDHGDCTSPQICDFESGSCITPTSTNCNDDPSVCEGNEYCHQSGECRINNCGSLSPSDCSGLTPIFDGPNCQCVACIDATHCGAGQVCNNNVCEDSQPGGCQIQCSSATPGTCSGTGTPYCINDCCVQCLGAADCGSNELCLDGFCGSPPDCSADPSICPTGYTCNASGDCVPPQTGQDCSSDPLACPDGTFCDPDTGQCQGFGGEFGCGFCNPDCSCPNGLTCNGLACEGCIPNPFGPSQCPQDQICDAIFTQMCIPNIFQGLF